MMDWLVDFSTFKQSQLSFSSVLVLQVNVRMPTGGVEKSSACLID